VFVTVVRDEVTPLTTFEIHRPARRSSF